MWALKDMRRESAWIALGNSRASLSLPTLKPQWLFLAPGQAQASRLCKIILDLINHTASIIPSKNKAELVFSLSSECTSLMPTSLTLSSFPYHPLIPPNLDTFSFLHVLGLIVPLGYLGLSSSVTFSKTIVT